MKMYLDITKTLVESYHIIFHLRSELRHYIVARWSYAERILAMSQVRSFLSSQAGIAIDLVL